ncbi:MAG: hypothetical protein K6T86_12660 [Pirellulales bacterium]|nr:hypothetical protein [Pirellulales bacterium]
MPEIRRVILTSDHHYGKRLPPQAGLVIQLLPSLIADSVSMAFRRRSRFAGKKPGWFKAATDIRFIAHEGEDKSELIFEVPRFAEAAPELYQQQELWPLRPDAWDTGFEVFGDVLGDISSDCRDSDRFDGGLLNHVLKLRPLFRQGIVRDIEVGSRRHANGMKPHVNSAVLDSAQRMHQTTPTPRRLKLHGTLDMLRVSTQAFGIKLASGEEAPGVLVQGDVCDLQGFLNCRVTVYGRAVYRPSGRLLRIEAEEIVRASDRDRFFATIPPGTPPDGRFKQTIAEQAVRGGLAAIIGKWPGDETDEQIQEALHRLS